MKRVLTILCSLSTLLVGSCTKDIDALNGYGGNAVEFSVSESVITRAVTTQDSFTTDNTIGIYMAKADGTALSENVQYTVGDSGLTHSDNNTGVILYPTSGETVTFYAYSPYPTVSEDGTIAVNILTDSNELLVSDKPTGSQSTTTAIALTFAHTLSKLAITYTPTLESPALTRAYVIGSTTASYKIADGTLSATDGAKATIEATITENVDDKTQSVDVIILPDNKDDSIDIYFEYEAGGDKLANKITLYTQAFSSGYIYTYDLTLGDDEATLCAHDIVAWSDESLSVDTSTKYIGNGSESEPWGIYTEDDLGLIGTSSAFGLDAHYVLMNDITLTGEWTPIGDKTNAFTGSFDGGGCTVSGITITDATADYQGLFGYISAATIENLSVDGSISSSKAYIGGIAGYATGSSKIINCSNSVDITDSTTNSYCTEYGGIVGAAKEVTIVNCYNEGAITGKDEIGGIAGYVYADSTIINCWCSSDSTITANGYYLGGIAGITLGKIYNSYNQGAVVCTNTSTGYGGGIVGYNGGTINNCYNTGTLTISSANDMRSGIAYQNNSSGTITNCYYCNDVVTKCVRTDSNSTVDNGMPSTEMQDSSFAVILNNGAFALNDTDGLLSGSDYKACAWEATATGEYPSVDIDGVPEYKDFDIEYMSSDYKYYIYSANGLHAFRDLVNGSANTTDAVIKGFAATQFSTAETYTGIDGVLTTNIDLDSEEWTPIGPSLDYKYSGEFDGADFVISGLKVSGSNQYAGLFGYCSGSISNLDVAGSVSSSYDDAYIGGLAGYNSGGSITKCYNSATVTGTAATSIGGLAGYNSGSIFNSYNTAEVSGTATNIGGLVGQNDGDGITNCYNSAAVSGDTYTYLGGVVGYNNSDGTINNCLCSVSLTGTNGKFGGVAGSNDGTVTNCYSLSTGIGTGNKTATTLSTAIMADASFLSTLNNNASKISGAYAWKVGTDSSYPIFNESGTATATTFDIEYKSNGAGGHAYYINSANGLHAFRDLVNGSTNTKSAAVSCILSSSFESTNKNISGILTTNIDLNNEAWTPIGKGASSYCYSGTFDGKGYAITGLNVSGEVQHAGLFGYIYLSGAIYNLSVAGSVSSNYSSGYKAVGGLVGYFYGASTSYVINCCSSVTVSVTHNDETSYSYVGGLVGYNYYNSIIANCYSSGSVSDSGTSEATTHIGGLVGSNYNSIAFCPYIINCYSSATVTATDTGSTTYSGGLCGYNRASGYIYCSYWNTNNTETGIGSDNNSDDTTAVGKTEADMTATTFGDLLNTNVNTYKGTYSNMCTWEQTTGSYPTLTWGYDN